MEPIDATGDEPHEEPPLAAPLTPEAGVRARRWAMAGGGLLAIVVLVVLALALGRSSDDPDTEGGVERGGVDTAVSGPVDATDETPPGSGTREAATSSPGQDETSSSSAGASTTAATAAGTTTSRPEPTTSSTTPTASSVPASTGPAPAASSTAVASQGPSPAYPGAPVTTAPAATAPPTSAGAPTSIPASTDSTEAPTPDDPEAGDDPPDLADPPVDDAEVPNEPQPVTAATACFEWSGPPPVPEPPVGSPLDDALGAIAGRWAGTATVPEGSPPIGDVWFEFYPYGGYTSSCLGATGVAALGAGGNCACSTNQIRALVVRDDGSFDAEIDVSSPVNGVDWIEGSSATTGQLRGVLVVGDVMTFSFVPTWAGEVPPITYRLQRVV